MRLGCCVLVVAIAGCAARQPVPPGGEAFPYDPATARPTIDVSADGRVWVGGKLLPPDNVGFADLGIHLQGTDSDPYRNADWAGVAIASGRLPSPHVSSIAVFFRRDATGTIQPFTGDLHIAGVSIDGKTTHSELERLLPVKPQDLSQCTSCSREMAEFLRLEGLHRSITFTVGVNPGDPIGMVEILMHDPNGP